MGQVISVQPVVLCGGSGSRLWPLSRVGFPKQFLCLTGEESLFQQATRRLVTLGDLQCKVADPLIVCNEEHRFLAVEQLREAGIPIGAALLEPCGRNTAPALTLAALAALEQGQDPVLVVAPADQTVTDGVAFAQSIHRAIRHAAEGVITILGIAPDHPETGYGYIKAAIGESQEYPSAVECFVEKPDFDSAQRYLEEGGYFWNAGIFVLKASAWMAALARLRPEIAAIAQKAWGARQVDAKFVRPGKAEFLEMPDVSVDYAVLEKCPGSSIPIAMVLLEAGWSDLGAWDAVWEKLPKDAVGNAMLGDVLSMDTRNTLVHASNRLVSLVGVEDLVVVETADAVLVASKSRSQEVKQIVSLLGRQGREEQTLHRKVHRPWGWYDCIDEGDRFRVKRIQVNPKSCLSLQKHRHRAEHWIVVRGTAEITCGDKVFLLKEDQSTYIPLGEIHRLSNPGTTPLEIIEVQSGEYLGEDDIIRLEDHYGRGDLVGS